SAREYFAVKKQLMPEVMKAYSRLCEKNDIIVIEGAGSPAEINLKDDDIVNMGMAKAARSPVLLVGDIDRGGVFAQLYGTVALLPPEEQRMVKGIIVNKFRGDESILTPGVRQIEELLHIPAVGVVPYMRIDVDDEDSLSERLTNKKAELIDIAVIRVPRLSNFTDFNVLDGIDGVSLRYVDSVRQFGEPDMVILPGTKNTMKDLLWMRQNGLEAKVIRHASGGGAVLGICGGYQMLGKKLSDPLGVEEGGSINGMGLLPTETEFSAEKERTRVTGRFGDISGVFSSLSGLPFEGYEIHMGRTDCAEPMAELLDSVTGQKRSDGCQSGSVYGTYVHGILDMGGVAEAVISALAAKKGIALDQVGKVSNLDYKQQQYDILAATMREHMDMKKIYEILEAGI
ncbi:MAG: cobyric acid synthase, partial [Oscillospiraceae bacterium]|nr:cobyric acid synthase [Oscillospiraceae bacterium]